MAIIVQKFGGSSVADVQKIGEVADRVVATRRAGHDVVVVVSAMGKTTDELIALARAVAKGAGPGFEPPRRELDMLVSTGERVTMALLSIAIHARGEAAISFTGSQSGILTNDRHFDARIIEVRPHRIEDELARGRVVIVAGYQGMSYKREITTLGRGGSDTTAVALAAALSAERCEIYSDVDGVYSADPRSVPESRHLPAIDLSVLAEMAESGAKVLNAQAVEWARRSKISIVARRTSDRDGQGKETVASSDPLAREVRAVVGMDRVVVVRGLDGQLEAVLEAARTSEVPLVDARWVQGEGVHAAIALANVPDWDGRRSAFEAIPSVTLTPGAALVSVVGAGLADEGSASLRRVLQVLHGGSIAVKAVHAGPLRITATIDAGALVEAQRALHAEFVG